MEGRIVFIDGYCVLCHRLAKYIIKHDKNKTIAIASLQGNTAKNILPAERLTKVDTVLYSKEGIIYERSTAALHVISDLGGWRKLLKLLFVFPRPLRDWVYNGIATHRYRWFGKNNTCQLPNNSNRKRVLD